MVEFYQLNRGSLSTRLSHYIVSLDSANVTNETNDVFMKTKFVSNSNPDVNTKSNSMDNQDLSLDSNPAEAMISSKSNDSELVIQESKEQVHSNGILQTPEQAPSSRQSLGSLTLSER